MSKRKGTLARNPTIPTLNRPGGQYTVETVNGLVPMPPPEVQEQLALAQAYHLHWCERWGSEMPTVNDVPVCQAITYELVQLLNKSLLQAG